jgi:hypothetical protein
MMSNPYRNSPDFCFWSRSVTFPAPGHIDPATSGQTIPPGANIATLGSCFAQHLARHIAQSGLNYFVAEPAPPELTAEEAARRNYGVFSARYGNVYTVGQALQLFDRAFGTFSPVEAVWRKESRFVDAFRPRIEPDGFESQAQVKEAAADHLLRVREMFARCDWLIFTLGLTEAWRSKIDGAVYPLAPGVEGGSYDPSKHEFVNFTVGETLEDLTRFIEKLREVNPGIRIMLTVSPVPLAATFENRHVLVSTCYSKAALRVAADHAERRFDNVVYFPSYEIITSPAAGGAYYADDLRQVTESGVKHVMRVFSRHFVDTSNPPIAPLERRESAAASQPQDIDVVCDEEAIESALRQSGF